jgi:hypothetical protein
MLEATASSVRRLVYDKKYWCLFFIFVAINFVVMHRSLADPGLILAGDFTRAEDFSTWISSVRYPLWNEHGQSSNLETLSQLGLYAPAIFISSVIEIPSTVVYLAYFVVLGSLSGVFSFKLAEYVMARQKVTPRFEFALASSLFFMFATFVVEYAFHPALTFGFYLSPLLLYALIKGVEENRISYLLLTSLIYSLMVAATHFVIFGLIIILSYILYDLFFKIVVQRFRSFSALKRAAWHTLIVVGPFIALSSYWLIPNIAYSGHELYYNLLTTTDPGFLYRYADVVNIFSVKGVFNSGVIYPYTDSERAYINILSIMLTITAVSSLLFYKENKFLLYLGILLVLSVIIAVTPHYFPAIYNWFMFDIPGSSIYSWVFRTPKFFHIMSVSIAIMLSLASIRIYQILHTQKKQFSKAVPSIFIAIVLVFSLVPNYILLTGDFNGFHRPHQLPPDYTDLLDYLEHQDGNYKSIWGPPYLGLNSTWSGGNAIGDLEQQISPTNIFSGSQTLNQYLYPLVFGIRYLYGSMVYGGQTDNLNEFLSPINVKYIVVHNDIPVLKDPIENVSTTLNKQKGFLESKEFGFTTLYTVSDASEQLSTKKSTMLIQGGGLLRYDSIFGLESITSNNTGVFFSDISLDQNPNLWNSSDTLIAENQLGYAEYMLDKSDVIVIRPSSYTNDYAPFRVWSISSANSPSFLNIVGYYYGIELPYQFDYGKNIIFTSASNSTLEIPLSISDPGEYKVLLRYFANEGGGMLDLGLNGNSQFFATKSHVNRFIWSDMETIRLSEGTHTLSITNTAGLNALNLIAIVPAEKYEHYKGEFITSLVNKDIIHVFEAESDLNFAGTAAVVQDIDYSNGKAVELRAQDIASTGFEILKKGNYNLAIYGEGTITIYIDGTRISTASLVDDGIAHIEPVSFNSGDHFIDIVSANGTSSSLPRLDSVLIGSNRTDNGQSSTIQQQPAEEPIINYQKIDPTNYEVTVKAQSPFMLAFAEAYDERWTAEVKTSNGVKSYKPLPLYGVINGFMIDTVGDYEIHIKYAPQEIFYIGASISAVSYAFIIGYLLRAHHLIFHRGRNN